MTKKILLIKEKLKTALTYNQLKELNEINVKKIEPGQMNEVELAYFNFRKLNLARISRLEKVYKPTDDALRIISKIFSPQIWMVITEDWCGDSAQTLPVIAALANLNNNIELKILLRDSNPEVMDLYLTNGKRSIPKLVVFDKNFNELFLWGPRPQLVQSIAEDLRKKGVDKDEIIKQIHLWYAKDGGYSTEKEILELLSKRLKTTTDQ